MSEEIRENFLTRLDECIADDYAETAHIEADDILCEVLIYLGYQDIVNKWQQVDKWYS